MQHDEERRLSFSTELPLSEVIAKIGAEHNYDVPMLIADSADDATTCPYLKGTLSQATPELAEKLAASRLVACAQVTAGGSLAVKTTQKARPAVEKLVPEVAWSAIDGNAPYLEWLDTETRDAAAKSCAP